MRSSESGSPGSSCWMCGASSLRRRLIICARVGAANGGDAVSMRCMMQPSAYKSLRASIGSPSSCSGLMNSGVPITRPVRVSASPAFSWIAFAIPKSTTFARENARQRLTLHVLHHEVDQPLAFTVVEHGGYVGMDDARRVRRLAGETRGGLVIVHQRRAHHLDGALAIHLHMLAEIHSAHPPLTDALEDVVALGHHTADQRIGTLGPQRRAVGRTEAC